MQTRDDIILAIGRDPGLAHAALFKHRHPATTPPFHEIMVRKFHSDIVNYMAMAFRGGAKSTIAEEGIAVEACLRTIRNAVVIGSSEARAVDRLRAIKNEFETNEFLFELFGDLRGEIWQETKIVLNNGVVMQALGRGQSMRGLKHLDQRPDLLLLDDIEDEESTSTPEARTKLSNWFYSVAVPALDPVHRIRVTATPLDVEALAMTFRRSAQWTVDVFPIEYLDPSSGERTATWPDRFPLPWIDENKETFLAAGKGTDYQREYMCEPEDPTTKTFTSSMVRVDPGIVRTWHPVYAMYDPARTTRATSDRTGKAVWSWIGPRLVIWDGAAELWKPDEIINDIFLTDSRYSPVAIGVEEDGLNEFLLQPLRTEQARRGQAVPIRPLRAPRGKIDFIKSLQPYFKAGEVIFAQPLPALVQQLLAFPTGKIDFVNALAYSLTLQPGAPIYDFNMGHIATPTPLSADGSLYLAINGTAQATCAILMQIRNGVLKVHADWMREGDPGQSLADILMQAQVEAGRPMTLVAPPSHFLGFDNIGLQAACAKVPITVRKGGALHTGREEMRALMKKQVGAFPALQVADTARWTLRALSGGYARGREKDGRINDFAADNAYKVLGEALECFAAMTRVEAGDDNQRNYAYTDTGQRYLTARPQGAAP